MDRQLIADLRLVVGDKLQEWVGQRRREGVEVGKDDQRQFANSIARAQLDLVERQRMQASQPRMVQGEYNAVVREILNALFGVGGIGAILERPDVANVFVHGTTAIAETMTGEVLHCGQIANTEDEVIASIQQLLVTQSRTSRQFNTAHPTVSAQLSSGLRLTATMEVSDKVSVAIRRPTIARVTLEQLVEIGTIPSEAARFLRALVLGEFNLAVAGGTNSGKTTLLRALCFEIPGDDRVVTVEDAAELRFDPDRHRNVVSLEAREANLEGVGEITLGDLAKLALRMSPKRVIVGEVRGGSEVVAMLSAMTQGNDGSMCTVHAESAEGALTRFRMYLGFSHGTPGDIAADMIGQAIDFVVHLARRRRDGRRIVTAIREVTGSEGNVVQSNEVFGLDQHGVLRPTGVISDRSREILADVGYDIRSLLIGSRP